MEDTHIVDPDKIEKLGYGLDTNVFGNEMTLDVFEVRNVESSGDGALSAILVEDDKQLVEEESQGLLRVFSRLKVAGDAVEAAKIFEAETFGAAFIDLSLPSINGRELCSQIKKVQPGCITVLLTNRDGEERSEGVDYIALRPLEEGTIRAYINRQ
ncbi:MAG: response regulator [Bacteroidetes bacterium]|nr:response regulator [Bacteroidota bacterium]